MWRSVKTDAYLVRRRDGVVDVHSEAGVCLDQSFIAVILMNDVPLAETYPGMETFGGLAFPPPVTAIWAHET